MSEQRMDRVLVLNSGSSSLKWSVLDPHTEAVLAEESTTWEGSEPGQHEAELAAALSEAPDVDAIGHRVVHGGDRFRSAILVDGSVREGIAAFAELAPLHNPAALAGIEAAARRFPGVLRWRRSTPRSTRPSLTRPRFIRSRGSGRKPGDFAVTVFTA